MVPMITPTPVRRGLESWIESSRAGARAGPPSRRSTRPAGAPDWQRDDPLDRHLGEAEVDELDDVVRALDEHHVARLHVAVDDAHRVRRGERRGDLPGDARPRAPAGAGPRLMTLAQRLAADVLEHEEVRAVVELAEVGGRGHVGVGHVRAGDGLALEARDELGQVLGLGVEHLDRDPLLEGRWSPRYTAPMPPIARSSSIR